MFTAAIERFHACELLLCPDGQEPRGLLDQSLPKAEWQPLSAMV